MSLSKLNEEALSSHDDEDNDNLQGKGKGSSPTGPDPLLTQILSSLRALSSQQTSLQTDLRTVRTDLQTVSSQQNNLRADLQTVSNYQSELAHQQSVINESLVEVIDRQSSISDCIDELSDKVVELEHSPVVAQTDPEWAIPPFGQEFCPALITSRPSSSVKEVAEWPPTRDFLDTNSRLRRSERIKARSMGGSGAHSAVSRIPGRPVRPEVGPSQQHREKVSHPSQNNNAADLGEHQSCDLAPTRTPNISGTSRTEQTFSVSKSASTVHQSNNRVTPAGVRRLSGAPETLRLSMEEGESLYTGSHSPRVTDERAYPHVRENGDDRWNYALAPMSDPNRLDEYWNYAPAPIPQYSSDNDRWQLTLAPIRECYNDENDEQRRTEERMFEEHVRDEGDEGRQRRDDRETVYLNNDRNKSSSYPNIGANDQVIESGDRQIVAINNDDYVAPEVNHPAQKSTRRVDYIAPDPVQTTIPSNRRSEEERMHANVRAGEYTRAQNERNFERDLLVNANTFDRGQPNFQISRNEINPIVQPQHPHPKPLMNANSTDVRNQRRVGQSISCRGTEQVTKLRYMNVNNADSCTTTSFTPTINDLYRSTLRKPLTDLKKAQTNPIRLDQPHASTSIIHPMSTTLRSIRSDFLHPSSSHPEVQPRLPTGCTMNYEITPRRSTGTVPSPTTATYTPLTGCTAPPLEPKLYDVWKYPRLLSTITHHQYLIQPPSETPLTSTHTVRTP